jgi:hypothetical protein
MFLAGSTDVQYLSYAEQTANEIRNLSQNIINEIPNLNFISNSFNYYMRIIVDFCQKELAFFDRVISEIHQNQPHNLDNQMPNLFSMFDISTITAQINSEIDNAHQNSQPVFDEVNSLYYQV